MSVKVFLWLSLRFCGSAVKFGRRPLTSRSPNLRNHFEDGAGRRDCAGGDSKIFPPIIETPCAGV
jgi:hypothetical protein